MCPAPATVVPPCSPSPANPACATRAETDVAAGMRCPQAPGTVLGATEAGGAGAGDGRRAAGVIEAAALRQVVQTREFLSSAEADKGYFSKLPWFEPHRGAGRNVETKPIGGRSIELQRAIYFEEMVVRANLNRPVSGVDDTHARGRAARVEFDI